MSKTNEFKIINFSSSFSIQQLTVCKMTSILMMVLIMLPSLASGWTMRFIFTQDLIEFGVYAPLVNVYNSYSSGLYELTIQAPDCIAMNGIVGQVQFYDSGVFLITCKTCDVNQTISNNDCVCLTGYNRVQSGRCVQGAIANPMYPDPIFYYLNFLTCELPRTMNDSGICLCPVGQIRAYQWCIPNICMSDQTWLQTRQQCMCNDPTLHNIVGVCGVCPPYTIWKQQVVLYPLMFGKCVCTGGAIYLSRKCVMCDPNSIATNSYRIGCICADGYVGNGFKCRRLRTRIPI